MRNLKLGCVVALGLALGLASVGVCQNAQGQRQVPSSPIASPAFDPHDFSGIWLFRGGRGFTNNNAPPMMPWAKAKFDAAKPGLDVAGGRAQPLGNDPIMMCDPVGYPRIMFFGAYPLEMIQLPGRIIQLFDFFYAHRTIYTDGRKLPADPEPTWYGYSVGHWEGDTLVVNSNAFNGRAWFDDAGRPYSEDATLEESYKRADHDTISLSMTLTDPTAYTKPWVSAPMSLKWSPKEVIREDLCAPSDEQKYKDEVRDPAGRRPGQ